MSVPYGIDAQTSQAMLTPSESVERRSTAAKSMRSDGRRGLAPGLLMREPPRSAARVQLDSFIRQEIIPRLALAHRDYGFRMGESRAGGTVRAFRPEEVVDFTRMITERSFGDVVSFVESLRAEGRPLAEILLDLFAPSARRLGDLWKDDRIDFFDVTIGLSRLQQLLRNFALALGDEGKLPCAERPRALLGPAIGEQHTFGVFMVGEFFRRAGWTITDACIGSADELADAVADDWYDIAGFSLSCESRLEALAAQIKAARAASLNSRLQVMVGGRVFSENPQFVSMVDADATAADGEMAVKKAQFLIGGRYYPLI